METSELLKKVRTIEIKTRSLSKHIFAGEYHSAFKGKGMAFSEVREYQYGDDIRSIDWNVTARFNHPYIKIFEEERELTVMLIIDVSASENFGSDLRMKRELLTEIAAVISFSAIQNNDKVGVIFFSNKIEKFIPPKKGKKHILRIIRELLTFEPENKQTDIAQGLSYFTNVIKKRCTAFLISDFEGKDFSDAIRVANYKHDLIALRIFDKRERELPDIGYINLKDAETGESLWVDTSLKSVRNHWSNYRKAFESKLQTEFLKNGVDYVSLRTEDDYVKPLINLFKRR